MPGRSRRRQGRGLILIPLRRLICRPGAGKLMLTATLTRPSKITAANITITHREPTLALCRALVAAGHPDGPMTVVDSATGRPVMHVASIAQAAELTVKETNTGPRFAKWVPFPGKAIFGEDHDG
jgi:hypothetical protein